MMEHVSRRDALRSGTSAAALLLLGGLTVAHSPAPAAAAPTPEQFIAMSRTLTGQPSLDSGMAQTILDAFMAAGQGDELARLIADPDPARSQAKIADAVVAAWYSGLSPLPGARQVTGFNEALVWDALSYTKPWGSCGGETGYWGEPPDGEEP